MQEEKDDIGHSFWENYAYDQWAKQDIQDRLGGKIEVTNPLLNQTMEAVWRDKADKSKLYLSCTNGKLYAFVYIPDCCASCEIEEVVGDLSDLEGSPLLMAEVVCSYTPADLPDDGTREAVLRAEKERQAYSLAIHRAFDGEGPIPEEREFKYGDESCTWTFLKLATAKGYVTVRWYGSSNGYYSEMPSFREESYK